jgi:transcriptional regulator with XRE-family HTH domain
MTNTLSTKIKKAREKAGLTQAELAEKLYVAQNTLGGWETGRHEPKICYLHEIADICDVRVSWLVGEPSRRSLKGGMCAPFRRRDSDSSSADGGQS